MIDSFATLGLSRTFDVSALAVENAYFEAQRRWHPDRFVALPQEERMAAAQASAAANDAYRILLDPFARAQHLLALNGVHVATDRDTVAPSQALLQEMLERREHLAQVMDVTVLNVLAVQIRDDISACVQSIADAFAGNDLNAAAHATLRLKYLTALEQEIVHHPAWSLSSPDLSLML